MDLAFTSLGKKGPYLALKGLVLTLTRKDTELGGAENLSLVCANELTLIQLPAT